MYRAYVTRASDQATGVAEAPLGDGADPDAAAAAAADNTPLIQQMLKLRQESAGLLGYAHHGEVSCASKMATFDEAVGLMEQLKTHAYAFATAEFIELQQFAEVQGFEGEMAPWDRGFYAERMREERFAFQEEELRPYFSLPRVLDGLFALGSRLFGIEIAAAAEQPPVWDEEVVLYEVSRDGKVVAVSEEETNKRPPQPQPPVATASRCSRALRMARGRGGGRGETSHDSAKISRQHSWRCVDVSSALMTSPPPPPSALLRRSFSTRSADRPRSAAGRGWTSA